jgi:Tfp pilus assembly protein PilF
MKAVTIKPEHAAAHEYLAEAYAGIGEEELACKHRDIADNLREQKRKK